MFQWDTTTETGGSDGILHDTVKIRYRLKDLVKLGRNVIDLLGSTRDLAESG